MKKTIKNKKEFMNFLKSTKTNPNFLLEQFGYPRCYPCSVEFNIETIEIENVGFGHKNIYRLAFTYKEDIEKQIENLKKELKELTEVK